MTILPLEFLNSHLFVEIDGDLWLIDTGAPKSFSSCSSLNLAGKQFTLATNYLGLTVAELSIFINVQCAGLLGVDILGHFDHIFDIPSKRLTVSADQILHEGQIVMLDEFMGIPIVTVQVLDSNYRMFLDTGAKISYFQNASITDFPSTGSVVDFYPGIGEFETNTYEVPISLGNVSLKLRCGLLPKLLGATLMMASTHGILGNAIFIDRTVGYFPRRRMMIL